MSSFEERIKVPFESEKKYFHVYKWTLQIKFVQEARFEHYVDALAYAAVASKSGNVYRVDKSRTYEQELLFLDGRILVNLF